MNPTWIRNKRALYSLIFLLLILLLFLGGGGYLGLFSTVTVTNEPRHYRIVGIENYGSYRKNWSFLRRTVAPEIERQELGGVIGAPVALVFNRFTKQLPKRERRSIVGYLLNQDAEIRPPLQVFTFDAPDALIAGINAHRSVAPFKAYGRLRNASSQDLTDQPALEIYHDVDQVEIIVSPEGNPVTAAE